MYSEKSQDSSDDNNQQFKPASNTTAKFTHDDIEWQINGSDHLKFKLKWSNVK